MSRRHLTVDGVEYPAIERLTAKGDRWLVLLSDGRERVAVWRLVRWEWEEERDQQGLFADDA
jgi:hypothetical protein